MNEIRFARFNPENYSVMFHVAKCGGSTLRDALWKTLGPDLTYWHPETDERRPTIIESSPHWLMAHFERSKGFGIERIAGALDGINLFTIIRDPFAMAFSMYRYLKYDCPTISHDKRPSEPHEVLDWYLDQRNFYLFDSLPLRLPGETMKEYISRFCFIGLIERYNESLDLLGKIIGVSVDKTLRTNVSTKEPFSRVEFYRAAYRNVFKEEYELYDEVTAIYDSGTFF